VNDQNADALDLYPEISASIGPETLELNRYDHRWQARFLTGDAKAGTGCARHKVNPPAWLLIPSGPLLLT